MTDRLNSFLTDLSHYKHSREDLMKHYIQERLSKSLVKYYDELYNNLTYLMKKEDLKVLKEYNKINV